MIMYAESLDPSGEQPPHDSTPAWPGSPLRNPQSRGRCISNEPDFGARLVAALERFGASLEAFRWSTREAIRLADRVGLLKLLKSRHEFMPADLESAVRSQEPEALAFRLAGDPRLMRAVQLLSMKS